MHLHLDYQTPTFYRFNEDSIHLVRTVLRDHSWRVPVPRVLDAFAGNGIVGIELKLGLGQVVNLEFSELQKDFELSLFYNWRLAQFEGVPKVHWGRISEMPQQEYDLVVANPPYFRPLSGKYSQKDFRKNLCRFFLEDSLSIFLSKLQGLLAPRGTAFFLSRDIPPRMQGLKILSVETMRGASIYKVTFD